MGGMRLMKWSLVVMALLALVVLGWWYGVKIVAWMTGILGLGVGGKLFRDYVKAEKIAQSQREQEKQHHQEVLGSLEDEGETEARKWREKYEKAPQEAAAKANGATTYDELQKQQDEALKNFSVWLDQQDGFARCSLKWMLLFLALLWLMLMQLFVAKEAMSNPAPTQGERVPTNQERQRAAKLFEVLRKARFTIKRLKQKHSLELRRKRLQCIHKLRLQQLDLRKERRQKQLLSGRSCPPQWSMLVIGGLVGVVSVGFAWGVVEWHRHSVSPKMP